MTEDASVVPLVTENRGEITGHAVYVDDKKSRSELECFVHDEYFVPKQEEHLIRPRRQEQQEQGTDKKKEGKKKRPIVKIDIREKLCSSLVGDMIMVVMMMIVMMTMTGGCEAGGGGARVSLPGLQDAARHQGERSIRGSGAVQGPIRGTGSNLVTSQWVREQIRDQLEDQRGY